jgi:hypothetical protein
VFEKQNVPDIYKTDPVAFADWINGIEDPDAISHPEQEAVRDCIGKKRGGRVPHGGILWRDISEKLFDGFPQVFGHSADWKEHQVRYCSRAWHTRDPEHYAEHHEGLASYCVDIGGKGDNPGDNCLAGVWLPEGRVVRVDL